MFSVYYLITRKQGNPIRQDVRNSSFIGVAPTHLMRGLSLEVSLSYILSWHNQHHFLLNFAKFMKNVATRSLNLT